MQSLVQRQFQSVVPGIALSLLTAGFFVDVLVAKKLRNEFDQTLVAKSSGLIALTEDGIDGFEVERYEVTLPNYTDVNNADYFEFVSDNGELFLKSLSLRSGDTLTGTDTSQATRFIDVDLPDGRAGRILRTRFLPRVDIDAEDTIGDPIELDAKLLNYPGSTDDAMSIEAINGLESLEELDDFKRIPLTLILASSRENVDSLIRSIHYLLVATGLITLGLILFVLRRGTNRAMSPLHQLADQVVEIDEYKLEQKLSITEPVEELNVLTNRFNFLLGRLQEAFTREQRITSDMAHELRTPVAEIRSLLDIHKQWPDDEELRQNFIGDIDTATFRMQRIIENLLQLARSQSSAAELARCDDLAQLITQRVEALTPQQNNREIFINVAMSDQNIAVAGFDQWIQIIDNLLSNAVEYSESNSIINLILDEVDGSSKQCVFEINNKPIDLDQQDISVMFDRLWQKDSARTSIQHTGLGLALVANYANQVGAVIEHSLVDGRFTVQLTFLIIE